MPITSNSALDPCTLSSALETSKAQHSDTVRAPFVFAAHRAVSISSREPGLAGFRLSGSNGEGTGEGRGEEGVRATAEKIKKCFFWGVGGGRAASALLPMCLDFLFLILTLPLFSGCAVALWM